MQEFDFTDTSTVNDLSKIVEHLSPEEATAALAAIKKMRLEKEKTKLDDFKSWFDTAFLPILKNFASTTTSNLTVTQDTQGDITATFINNCGFDITITQKRMQMVISAADHISINNCPGSNGVEFTLIFGLPKNEK